MAQASQPDNEANIKALLLSDDEKDWKDGMTQLVEEYGKWTRGRLRLAYPWVPAADLEDVFSDTLVAVWVSVRNRRFRDRGSLIGYLSRIARNKVVSLIRRNARRRLEQLDDDPDSPITDESIVELFEEIEPAFDQLHERDQQLILIDLYLYVATGFNWFELEDFTREYNRQTGQDLPWTTVKTRRWRAHSRLRNHLIERGNLS